MSVVSVYTFGMRWVYAAVTVLIILFIAFVFVNKRAEAPTGEPAAPSAVR